VASWLLVVVAVELRQIAASTDDLTRTLQKHRLVLTDEAMLSPTFEWLPRMNWPVLRSF
jgi:hypothetical protein